VITFLARLFLLPWWWRRYVSPKRRFLQEPHGAKSRKTALFIVTALKTSDLTKQITFSVRAAEKYHDSYFRFPEILLHIFFTNTHKCALVVDEYDCIYDVFNDRISSLGDNDWTIRVISNVKGSGRGLIWGIMSMLAWRDWRNSCVTSHDSRCPGRDLNTLDTSNTEQESWSLDRGDRRLR
jgi:hypothetical protein